MQYAYHRAINRRQHLEGREFYRNAELEEDLEVHPVGAGKTLGLTVPEVKALVRQSMKALSDPQKKVIEMACYGGLSMREIAERTGDSFVNVRHHYYRGLQKLRSFISGGDEQDSNTREESVPEDPKSRGARGVCRRSVPLPPGAFCRARNSLTFRRM